MLWTVCNLVRQFMFTRRRRTYPPFRPLQLHAPRQQIILRTTTKRSAVSYGSIAILDIESPMEYSGWELQPIPFGTILEKLASSKLDIWLRHLNELHNWLLISPTNHLTSSGNHVVLILKHFVANPIEPSWLGEFAFGKLLILCGQLCVHLFWRPPCILKLKACVIVARMFLEVHLQSWSTGLENSFEDLKGFISFQNPEAISPWSPISQWWLRRGLLG